MVLGIKQQMNQTEFRIFIMKGKKFLIKVKKYKKDGIFPFMIYDAYFGNSYTDIEQGRYESIHIYVSSGYDGDNYEYQYYVKDAVEFYKKFDIYERYYYA